MQPWYLEQAKRVFEGGDRVSDQNEPKPPTPSGGLIRKLAAIMAAVDRIPKRGHNQFHGYKYATESDVVEAVRKELADRHVMLFTNVINRETIEIKNRKGNTEYMTHVDAEFTFVDGETGETHTFRMSGGGQDSGEKGVFKAITGTKKYALMTTFLIPTGDDPENDSDSGDHKDRNQRPQANRQDQPRPQQQPTPEQARMQAIHGAAAKCYPDLKGDDLHKKIHDEVCNHFEIESLNNLTPEQVQQVIQGYNKRAAKAQSRSAT